MLRPRFRLVSALPIALLATTLGLATLPMTALGDRGSLPDYDVFNGHFYTQGNPDHANGAGFSITNEGGVPFWSAFEEFGGVDLLGYPISRRFLWSGTVSQITQKAVLQWSAQSEAVTLANTLDYLSHVGKDDWLRSKWRVPLRDDLVHLPPNAAAALERLQADEVSRAFVEHYRRVPDALQLYGLPVAAAADFEDFTALRFQRTVLQLWKVKAPGAFPGLVTSLNTGEVLKQAAILPSEVFVPESAPPTLVEDRRDQVSSRIAGGEQRGLATWYGYGFAGRAMRNGEIFDPEDEAIAASTTFPVGSWLRVTNVSTNASIDVRITDTGAFKAPVLVDLSLAAFRKLAHPDAGVIGIAVLPLHRN